MRRYAIIKNLPNKNLFLTIFFSNEIGYGILVVWKIGSVEYFYYVCKKYSSEVNTVLRGREAEDLALDWLLKHGFVLKERNYRVGHREVDLIVESERHIHIVEVKSLTAPVITDPLRKVDIRKQRLLASAASYYVASNKVVKEVQFDLVSVVFYPDHHSLEYVPGAFWPIYYR